MMAQDQGDVIMEGSDCLKPVASKKDQGGFTDDGVEIDEDHRVFLVKLGVFADVGKGKEVDKGSKRFLDPDEEIRQQWLIMEKLMHAADYDEEIQGGDQLTPEKALSAEDSDVQGDAGEFEARKGVDADEGEIGSGREEDDYDPDYMEFYQHLKSHRTAYVLEIGRGKDIKIVKYEEEGVSSDERKRKVPNPVGRPPRARRSDGLHREVGNLEIGRGQLKRDRKVPKPVGRPPKARRSNSLHSKVERDKRERLQIPYDSKMDKDYYMFLRGLEISADNLVYGAKDGVECRYNESSGSTSGSDSEASPKPPPSVGRATPEPSSKRRVPSGKRDPSNKNESDSDKGSPKPSPSIIDRMTPEPSINSLAESGKSVEDEFRQGAMDILLKPYNKKEHEDLLGLVRLRTPIMRSHETRSRCIQYPDENMMGKSYLDHHADLKKKYKAVHHTEPHKALHLLRALFFYNQRVCMEDSFMPWKDDSWLEAMNRSTSGKHD